jgi:excisionase family DNA binding protein
VISTGNKVNTVPLSTPSLVRLSELARFWKLHPRTLQAWIHQGRLVAIRSPGNHFRLRIADVRAFCEREGMAVPPFIATPTKRAVLATASDPLVRSVARALKGNVTLDAFLDPYAAVVAVADRPTDLFAVSAAFPRFDAAAATRALKANPDASALVVVAFDVTSRAQATALESAGACRTFTRVREQDLPQAMRELLGLQTE